MKSRQVKIARGSSLPFDTPPSSVVTLKKNTCCSSEAVTLQLVCHTNCGITMATCAAASSTRLVVNTSCRVRKTRTLASSQLAFTGSSTQQVRCHSFESRCTVPGGSPTSLFSHSLRSSFAPLPATALAADFCEAQYQGRQTYRELSLSAAALALTLGFAAANSSTSSDNGSSISSSKLSRKGGGSGGGNGDKPLSSVFASREKAEEDVRKVEEDAVQNPYMVSWAGPSGV